MFHSRPGGPAAQPPDLQKIEMPPKPKSSYNTQSQNTASSWKTSKQWFGRWHYRQDCLIARSILHLATFKYWLTIHIVWASLLPTSQSSRQQNLLCFFLNLCAWSIYRSRLHLSSEPLCLFSAPFPRLPRTVFNCSFLRKPISTPVQPEQISQILK